jgi:hypothetical protein
MKNLQVAGRFDGEVGMVGLQMGAKMAVECPIT